MFRPQRTTVLLAFAAEPVEKPDARLLALDCHSPSTLVSQSISPDHLALIITRSNDLKIHVRFVWINRGLVEDRVKLRHAADLQRRAMGDSLVICYQLLVDY
jgi:hypothetical protein